MRPPSLLSPLRPVLRPAGPLLPAASAATAEVLGRAPLLLLLSVTVVSTLFVVPSTLSCMPCPILPILLVGTASSSRDPHILQSFELLRIKNENRINRGRHHHGEPCKRCTHITRLGHHRAAWSAGHLPPPGSPRGPSRWARSAAAAASCSHLLPPPPTPHPRPRAAALHTSAAPRCQAAPWMAAAP